MLGCVQTFETFKVILWSDCRARVRGTLIGTPVLASALLFPWRSEGMSTVWPEASTGELPHRSKAALSISPVFSGRGFEHAAVERFGRQPRPRGIGHGRGRSCSAGLPFFVEASSTTIAGTSPSNRNALGQRDSSSLWRNPVGRSDRVKHRPIHVGHPLQW